MKNDNWYLNPKWQRIRKSVLRRDKYMDRERARFGIAIPAEIVHHIFPREEFPEFQYEIWNLISLSRRTHNEMHDRETDELTEKGMELLRRTCRRYNKPIPEKYMNKKAKRKGKYRDGYQY